MSKGRSFMGVKVIELELCPPGNMYFFDKKIADKLLDEEKMFKQIMRRLKSKKRGLLL